MQISRIRLSDKTSRLHPRHVVPKPAQAYEPEVPVKVREWIRSSIKHPLIRPAMPGDGVHPHAAAVHQPGGRGSDAAKTEDSAEPAREHAVPRELIELAKFEVFVLQDQALGGGKCHGERVLGHRLGIAAAVGCHWHTLRELA